MFFLQFLSPAEKSELHKRVVDPERYRPLIRLLRELDKDVPQERIREYLRLLTKDYAALLAQVRLILVESQIDRPDLARTLARNRAQFALALCRIEFRLWLYRTGLGGSETIAREMLALVDGTKALHLRASFLCESAVWGA